MLPTQYQEYIHLSRYARYDEEKKRRETWEETVTRYCDFMAEKFQDKFPYNLVHSAILNLEVMPSMRALMTAGPALERDNVAGFNCSYLPVDHIRAFDEALYILMCGTGVGYSVEDQYVRRLPTIAEELRSTNTTIIVEDSKIGWAVGLRQLISLLYSGGIPKWDLSKLRPAGARLKVFGGRASGPAPLEALFRFAVDVFRAAAGRKLSSLEAHDIMCKIADCVVVGGVRRSALICLSDLSDAGLRHSKDGLFWETQNQRTLANNSAVYNGRPDMGNFMDEWRAIYGSKSGERGIYNRGGAKAKAESTGRRSSDFDFGTNPCGEIILRPHGFCNLSEVVVRSSDSVEDLHRKVRIASIIGTFQSALTGFRYIRKIWRDNAEEERLLGVSLTGIMDHNLLSGVGLFDNDNHLILEELRNEAIETNKEWAARLGISPSVSITTVKPSGTVSQLVDSSSGIHPRYSRFYLRRVRADKKDPLAMFMRSMGFPVEADITKPDYTDVFTFPCRSPEESVLRTQLRAVEQLDHYKIFRDYWCEHNPSITVYIKEADWMEVAAWVYKHFDSIGGCAFLPYDGGNYQQAPYEDITEEQYNEWVAKMPQDVDWTLLVEETDSTIGSQELACMAGVCEVGL